MPALFEKFPLFDCPDVENDAGKSVHACPVCHERDIFEEISTRSSQRFDPIPVLVSYLCEEDCNPQRGERQHNDKDTKKREFFQKYDLSKLVEIEHKQIPYWCPPHRMMNVESNTESWGDKWRAGTSSFRTVAELFTKRNRWALALLRAKAIENKYSDTFLFGITAINLAVSRMQRYSPTSTFPNMVLSGTYYVPQIGKEYNVGNWYEGKIESFTKGYKQIDFETSDLIISTDSATKLVIPPNSVDFIFTDPPYSENIQYGELNFVWEAWLDLNTSWHDREIIVNETRGKTDIDWATLMKLAMNECFQALKPGRWISLCYHDTSEGTWQLVQDIMTEVGFIPENSSTTLFIDTSQKSFNQLMAEKVTKRDLVINFRKPRLGEVAAPIIINGEEDETTFQDKARAILADDLETHPGMTADRLYDELVSRMVRRGEFERHNFDELLRSVAEESNGRWYLLGNRRPGRRGREQETKPARPNGWSALCSSTSKAAASRAYITPTCSSSTCRSPTSRAARDRLAARVLLQDRGRHLAAAQG
jgi:hypothetical protein